MPTRGSSCRMRPTATDASTPSWSAGARLVLSNSSYGDGAGPASCPQQPTYRAHDLGRYDCYFAKFGSQVVRVRTPPARVSRPQWITCWKGVSALVAG